jgi:hypothetical protein
MNLDEALSYIKNNEGAVYACDESKLEIFFMEYEDDPQRFSPVIVFYSKYSSSESYDRYEDIFPVEDFFETFPNCTKLKFFPIPKNSLGYMNDCYEEVMNYLKSNHL